MERIGDLGAVTSHLDLFSLHLLVGVYNAFLRDKGVMPLKPGYADA
ncbi:hypothetical protein [Virgibacillus sp. 6R]|nr:hypothetical protein [Virgibacillus sp. 6R]MBS7426674.1 hypothetical protein [Virgibacillus sp. 19R1-5]